MNSLLIQAIGIFLVIAALFFAFIVFGPMAFALLFMAIVWPLDSALRKILPRGLALILTLMTSAGAFTSLLTGQITHWLII